MSKCGHCRGKKITKEQREEILALYLVDPIAASELAVSRGLSQIYAYKLAHDRGVIPLREWPVPESRA